MEQNIEKLFQKKSVLFEIYLEKVENDYCVELGQGMSGAGYFKFNTLEEQAAFVSGVKVVLKFNGIEFRERF